MPGSRSHTEMAALVPMAVSNTERPLPTNLDAEKALLGAVLLGHSPCALPVRSEDFFLPEHGVIFGRSVAMAAEGIAVDLLTIHDALEAHGEIERAGGPAYIASLVDGVPNVSNVDHYAQIVREKAELRRLARLGHWLTEAVLESAARPADLRTNLRTKLAAEWNAQPAARIVLPSAAEFLARQSAADPPWLVEGLLPARSQTIWQGRPKVGKSHTLLQAAFDMSSGLPVFGRFSVARSIRTVYVELEEPEAITRARFTAMLRSHGGQGPDADALRFFTREDLRRLKMPAQELMGARLRDFAAALRDGGAELVIVVALRKLVYGNLKDPEVGERLNDSLDLLASETGAAIASVHHSRKEAADTLEAQGLGHTFISAHADATFDISRSADGGRKVGREGRYGEETFYLRKVANGDGELIMWIEAPEDPKRGKREEALKRIMAGDSTREAANAAGVSHTTIQNWVKDAQGNS